MRRFWSGTAATTAALAVAMTATLAVPAFGMPMWHSNAGIAATVAVGAIALPAMRHRRVATLAMAFAGIVATVTGFVMLLTQQFPWKEWLTWWHVVTSVAFAFAFLVHWMHNNPRLVDLTRRLFAPRPALGVAAAATWAVVGALLAWTALPSVRVFFTRENYLSLSWWTIVAGVAVPYALWWAVRLPVVRDRFRVTATRNRARGLVDTGLFLSNWGALLTGFALLWLAAPLRDGSFKYVSKWWHTATSVALLAFVALHVGFNARLVARHARRVDAEL